MARRGFAIDPRRGAELSAWATCIALAALACWLLARLVVSPWLDDGGVRETAPHAPSAPAVAAARPIASWHLFGESSSSGARGGAGAAGASARLSISLRGTLAERDPGAGVAVIAVPGGGERAVRVGEEAEPGVRLAAVYPDRAVFTQGGVEQTLTLPREPMATVGDGGVAPATARPGAGAGVASSTPVPSASSGASPPATAPAALREAVAEARRNPGQLMQRVRIEPVFEGGSLGGVRISAASEADAGLLRQAGLQPGDLVTRVDGEAIDSIAHGQRVVARLATAHTVRITVERNGRPVELSLSLQ